MKSKNVTDLRKPHSFESAQTMSSSEHSQTACEGVSRHGGGDHTVMSQKTK